MGHYLAAAAPVRPRRLARYASGAGLVWAHLKVGYVSPTSTKASCRGWGSLMGKPSPHGVLFGPRWHATLAFGKSGHMRFCLGSRTGNVNVHLLVGPGWDLKSCQRSELGSSVWALKIHTMHVTHKGWISARAQNPETNVIYSGGPNNLRMMRA